MPKKAKRKTGKKRKSTNKHKKTRSLKLSRSRGRGRDGDGYSAAKIMQLKQEGFDRCHKLYPSNNEDYRQCTNQIEQDIKILTAFNDLSPVESPRMGQPIRLIQYPTSPIRIGPPAPPPLPPPISLSNALLNREYKNLHPYIGRRERVMDVPLGETSPPEVALQLPTNFIMKPALKPKKNKKVQKKRRK